MHKKTVSIFLLVQHVLERKFSDYFLANVLITSKTNRFFLKSEEVLISTSIHFLYKKHSRFKMYARFEKNDLLTDYFELFVPKKKKSKSSAATNSRIFFVDKFNTMTLVDKCWFVVNVLSVVNPLISPVPILLTTTCEARIRNVSILIFVFWF